MKEGREWRREGKKEEKKKEIENHQGEENYYFFLTLNSYDARYPNPLSKEEHQQSGKVLKL